MAKIKQGRLFRVNNKLRPNFSNANTEYIAVWVDNTDGKNERCLLFTEKEIEKAEYRASKNPEDLTKKGALTDFFD